MSLPGHGQPGARRHHHLHGQLHHHPGRPGRRLDHEHRHRYRRHADFERGTGDRHCGPEASPGDRQDRPGDDLRKVGDVIHYSYLVTNAGNVTLHDPITVSDDKATDESCPALPVGGLAPGESITCSASYTITQADLDAGSLTNVASATDGATTSPTDTVTVPATRPGAVTDQERQPDHLQHGRPDHQLQLRAEEHRQRDPQRPVHGHRRQGHRHLPGRVPAWRSATRSPAQPATRSRRPTSTTAK